MKAKIAENEIEYTPLGDYQIPDIVLPEERRPIGRWGRIRREYLREHHPVRYNSLIFSGQLWTHLADLNEQAQARAELLVAQMKASEGVTEKLKAADQLAWTGAMNSIRNRAEEIVLRELIFAEDAT